MFKPHIFPRYYFKMDKSLNKFTSNKFSRAQAKWKKYKGRMNKAIHGIVPDRLCYRESFLPQIERDLHLWLTSCK